MIRTVTTVSFGSGRRHLAVNRSRDGWCLQWATPTAYGHTLDKPIERGFKTKHEATERKRAILAQGRNGPVIEVVSAVILREGRILLTQRRPGKTYAFAWETPGGKSELSDSWHSALRRECMEELGVTIGRLDEHPISSPLLRDIQFLLYAAREWSGEPRPLEGQGIGWFTWEEMRRLTLTPGTEGSLRAIAEEMRRSL